MSFLKPNTRLTLICQTLICSNTDFCQTCICTNDRYNFFYFQKLALDKLVCKLSMPNFYFFFSMSAAAKRWRYLRRLVFFRQMDFEFAFWQMIYLMTAPHEVKSFYVTLILTISLGVLVSLDTSSILNLDTVSEATSQLSRNS